MTGGRTRPLSGAGALLAVAGHAGVTVHIVERRTWDARPADRSLVEINGLATRLRPRETREIVMRGLARHGSALYVLPWPPRHNDVGSEEDEDKWWLGWFWES